MMLVGTDPLGTKVEIPTSTAATTGTAILAMRGAGKSWLNAVLAEGLSKARMPFALIDPEGEYWTIRVKFPNVVVAGGDHADIPLDVDLAEILATAALDERLELVLDLSDMRREQQTMFLSRFLGQLFAKETSQRIPFWVSFEEADLWVPQVGNPPCKVAVLDICQRGRKRGLGFALVTQRPATVDKTALSQAEFRFFKRFQQPHDLRAVSEYLGSFAGLADILPALAVEDALLYAPTLSSKPIRLRVAPRESPHGGATPEQIALIEPSTTILALRDKLNRLLAEKRREQSIMEQFEQRIRELEQQLAQKEEELSKTRLASDVAEILVESRARLPAAGHETGNDAPEPSKSGLGISATKTGEPLVNLGTVAVDLASGSIVGNDLANLLLNRLNQDERVVFLLLKRPDRPCSLKEVRRLSGFGQAKTRRIVRQLLRKGMIKLAGRERGGQLYVHQWEEVSEET